ncbi:hypothetical protein R1flu_014812 [Riccia fluitans]|uniref:DNA mismatch repair proteins mutS family domain-containing protein n=1 Tax=Riccia fluitans TaxID=41844 RepID=A0ABD1YHJ7_9MARC
MSETAPILEKATPQSLVRLDEVGRGTGSQEWEMIARAITEYLARQVKARTVLSTHYHQLHDLDLELENVSNYHLEAVETPSGDVVFDHTVRPGYALRSYAVGVARASGMPEWVCNRATELLAEVTDADGRGDKITGTRLSQRDFQDENQRGTSGLMGELGMNYLDETEDLAVPGGPGAEAEQQESVLLSEIFRDSNSESEGNCSDLLVEANVTPEDKSRGYKQSQLDTR